MDHLPLPQDRCIGSIAIPFLASDTYTSPFRTYPQRNGWNYNLRGNLDPIITYTPTSQANRELGSLMQTWLYFGLLSEFLELPVDMKLFQRESEFGTILLSSELLESLVSDRTYSLLEQSKQSGPAVVESWRDAFYGVLLLTRHYTIMTVAKAAEDDQAVSLVGLGISALAEHLMTALYNLCGRVSVEIPVTQEWRLIHNEFSMDCGLPIIKSMRQKGWCPHDIARFNGAQIKTVSTLWYLANLSPPKGDMSHSACNSETCLPLQMIKSQYVQAHTSEGCNCSSVGPDQSKLASIVWSGKTPILALQGDEIVVEGHVPGSGFVAVSHVWADGKGNPYANSLPLCIVRELQRLVNELLKDDSIADTRFWIDTLCVPRSPRELKLEALQRLKEPYEEATCVLVIDSYLRGYSGSGVSPYELLARIASCGWSQRLWTFQEGRLPTEPARVWFTFRDRSVDLLKEVNLHLSRFPTLALHTIHYGLVYEHNQTQLIGSAGVGFTEDHLRSISMLRTSLRTRMTSEADDEALCLGTILRLSGDSIRNITQARGEARMARLWEELPQIPVGMAFSKARRKLRLKGYRWAPTSFMGSLDLGGKDWEGPNDTWSPPFEIASLLSGGLAIRRPTWILGVGEPSSQGRLMRFCDIEAVPKGKIVPLYDRSGRCFNYELEEAWHDAAQKANVGDLFVIILAGWSGFGNAKTYVLGETDFDTQGSQSGLLASYSPDLVPGKDGVIQVTVHRHVRCTMVSKKAHEVRTLLKPCADKIYATYMELLVKQGKDEQALDELISNAVKHDLSNNPAILQLMKTVNAYHQWGDDDALALDDAIAFVKTLVELGPCHILRQEVDDTTWCVD